MTNIIEIYRNYKIRYETIAPFNYGFSHQDYDGEGDRRYGYADTIEACRQEIDDIEDNDDY